MKKVFTEKQTQGLLKPKTDNLTKKPRSFFLHIIALRRNITQRQ